MNTEIVRYRLVWIIVSTIISAIGFWIAYNYGDPQKEYLFFLVPFFLNFIFVGMMFEKADFQDFGLLRVPVFFVLVHVVGYIYYPCVQILVDQVWLLI